MQQFESSHNDTHIASKTTQPCSRAQSIDELRQDWRNTFEELGALIGGDLSGYADGFNDLLNKEIAAGKEFTTLTHGGSFHCAAEPLPAKNRSQTPADRPDPRQRLLNPKILQDITCRYGSCGVRVRGIDAFKTHLQVIHDLTDRGTANGCKYSNCPSRDMRGLLHVLRDHSGLHMQCRECGKTFLITWAYQLALRHWKTKHWDLYIEEDNRLVYYDEVCESE